MSQVSLARIEDRIDRAEAQVEEMRKIRSAVLWKAGPGVLLIGAFVFGSFGWGPTEPIPVAVGGVLLGGLAAFGIGAHFGVRHGERRLAEMEEDFARQIGRASGEGSGG